MRFSIRIKWSGVELRLFVARSGSSFILLIVLHRAAPSCIHLHRAAPCCIVQHEIAYCCILLNSVASCGIDFYRDTLCYTALQPRILVPYAEFIISSTCL